MSGTKITPGFLLLLSFARCVIAADSGDDFSNNLFSDLAPLLSLLGEQVTMQFMSQAMGWTDNVILAMAPLGIITIIVSAIRVGGPSWLKALVGRARENLAVVEASLMSSTSKEVCELWNGQAVVRSMGAAPIGEFICLLPEGFRDGEDAKWGVPEVMTLEGAINTGLLDEIPKPAGNLLPDPEGRGRVSTPQNSGTQDHCYTESRGRCAKHLAQYE
ncbi:hypothetical protein F5144DRAFT_59685 [Chaetomium tenue]|uniref:Uncharacterized protein n=1 Tax=Chaetomium tenue TaxID=1854479 RepID=A0ACB7PNU1_9PEZI|nr:hypothetical protein F5144DRAFT_59685 [Chaetomium globosum]